MSSIQEPWLIAVIVIVAVVVTAAVVTAAVRVWAAATYRRLPKTAVDIDAFVGDRYPVNAVKVALLHKFQLGSRVASTESIPIECVSSPHVTGLLVSQRAAASSATAAAAGGNNDSSTTATPLQQILAQQSTGNKPVVVICTIRMGFGHHRLAYSAASWALQAGYCCIFHDLLNIDSREADLIRSTDELYSRFSRYASEMGGCVERAWGGLMKSGDADALRVAALTAAHLRPLVAALPADTPVVSTHQLCALTAAAAGFTNVVNLVVDNHPQWFLVVPRTLNIVQGPVNYQQFLRMGVPASDLQWTGHWCPFQLVDNIDADCRRRIDRCHLRRTGGLTAAPLRVLVPVGGAGAQRKFIVNFVRALADRVKAGHVELLLNAGDHEHMKTAFLDVLEECRLEFDTVSDSAGTAAFQRALLTGTEANAGGSGSSSRKAVTLFSFQEYFPAVATTDQLCRCADVLACKPSELAFYCVPKLHIRRVGDHEADSAARASELGDGTVEAREVSDAMRFMELFLSSPDLLVSMNEAIMSNNREHHYDGCKRAVQLALERSKRTTDDDGKTKKE